jgi:hypothetical protein
LFEHHPALPARVDELLIFMYKHFRGFMENSFPRFYASQLERLKLMETNIKEGALLRSTHRFFGIIPRSEPMIVGLVFEKPRQIGPRQFVGVFKAQAGPEPNNPIRTLAATIEEHFAIKAEITVDPELSAEKKFSFRDLVRL